MSFFRLLVCLYKQELEKQEVSISSKQSYIAYTMIYGYVYNVHNDWLPISGQPERLVALQYVITLSTNNVHNMHEGIATDFQLKLDILVQSSVGWGNLKIILLSSFRQQHWSKYALLVAGEVSTQ